MRPWLITAAVLVLSAALGASLGAWAAGFTPDDLADVFPTD